MITEKEFKMYLEVQYSGRYNMLTEAKTVMQLIGLTKEQYFYLIQNYGDLLNKYGQA